MGWVVDQIPEGVKTILDLGAGPGHFANFLASHGFEVTSAELVLGSLRKFRGNRVQANCQCLPFKANSFDLVLCAEVIEHLDIQERALCLREIWRIARHYILVTVPNDEDLSQMLIRCARCSHIFHAWGHRDFFNTSRMKGLFPVPPMKLSNLADPETYYFPPLLFIRQKIFNTYGYDSCVVCPNCFTTDISEPKRSFPVKVLDRMNYALRFKKQCGWLLAIYDRNQEIQKSSRMLGAVRESDRAKPVAFGPRVDRLLMTIQSRCELVENGVSQRLGIHFRKGAIIAHESLLRRGWDVSSLSNLKSVPCLPKEFPTGLPWIPVITPFSKTVTKRAEQPVLGFCRIDSTTTLNINELSWTPDPFGNGTMISRFLFHCLEGIQEMVNVYWLTKNTAYLDDAKAIAHRWISECLFVERHPLVWDDHITAIRSLVLCRLWLASYYAKKDSYDFTKEICSAILRHGRRLATKGFYRPRHNHGVTQAYALFVVGLLISSFPEATGWAEVGRRRLEQQMAQNVSCEGVHREHSPFYHFYVFKQFLSAYRFGAWYDVRFSREFCDRLIKMLQSGTHLVKPNGTLPAIGDTCKSSPVAVNRKDVTDWFGEGGKTYHYSVTQGREGSQPQVTSVIFPDAGLAMFRSGWGNRRPFQEEIFASVRLCTYDTSHVHRDQGTFELYAYGADLIVDSGGPFAYGDPMREFFISTAAHNTVVVDGRNQEIGKAVVRQWQTSNDCDVLVIEHRSYPGVVHRRTIIFVRPYYFVVADRLNALRLHTYTQMFHLAAPLRAHLEGLTIRTTNVSNGPTIQVMPLFQAGLNVRLRTGTREPVQGWISTGEQQKIANTVIEYERSGENAEFVVVLVPQGSKTFTPVSAQMEDQGSSGRRIVVSIGEQADTIFIDKADQVNVTRRPA